MLAVASDGAVRAGALTGPGPHAAGPTSILITVVQFARVDSGSVRQGSSAWRAADEAARLASVEIAPLRTMADSEAAAALVQAVWGELVLEPALIRAFQHAGSVTLAALDDGRMVGFVLGFVGTDDGTHLHSHILGVLPEWQSRGVGHALKVAQRAAALDMGLDEVRWTYDPLIARNARFNLVKLGTTATRFLPEFYGAMRDAVNRGDRSDRFEVRWRLTSDRVERAIRGELEAPADDPCLLLRPDPDGGPAMELADKDEGRPWGVAIPLEFQDLRRTDPSLAGRWREAASEVFARCFARGLAATWFSRDGTYTFEPQP